MNLAEMLKMADTATQGVELNDGDFSPIKPGTYDVAVTEAAVEESKRTNPNNPSEHGQLIKMKLTITGGEFANRTVFLRNNILVYPKTMSAEDQTKAQKAMAMGARERKVILDSLGKTGIEDASELIGATFRAEIALGKYNDKVTNEVKKILPSSGKSSSLSASPAPAATASAPKAKLPWEK